MNRINIILIFTFLLTIGSAQKSEGVRDMKLTEKQLIKGLSDMDTTIRATCAKKITELLLNKQNVIEKGNIIEYSSDYWTNKLNSNKSTMKKEEFEKEFFDTKIDFDPNYDNVKFYQLDHFHQLSTEITKKKVKLKSLTIDPIFFNFEPNNTFSGKWRLYYITGSIYREAEYTEGIKHGIDIIYDWRGNKSWLKHYENGEVKKLYRFKKGEMYEASLKFLEVEGEAD